MDNYKQIKSDLDQLRSIVEKSELWVYKRQGEDGMDADGPSESDHKKKVLGNTQPISKFPSAKDCWSTSSGKKNQIHCFYLFLSGRLSGIRQARRNQQLQLQGCERGLLF